MPTRARYDGYGEWYDSWNQPNVERNAAWIQDLLGPGEGLCLDLGCGSGHYFGALAGTGRTVVGLDFSADQLRHARTRSRRIVQGDGAALPFADGTFATVATMWTSTDVDDFAAVLAEGARVLAPGGLLVFCGVHPCFNGPHVEWLDDGGMRVHTTYRQAGWHAEAPYWGENVRKRVGMRHNPLADLINGFIRSGLAIEYAAELGDRAVPNMLAIRARKPGALARPPGGGPGGSAGQVPGAAQGQGHDGQHGVEPAVGDVDRAVHDPQVVVPVHPPPSVGHRGRRVVTHPAGSGLVLTRGKVK
jgi:SAM-dependent methyltransferase